MPLIVKIPRSNFWILLVTHVGLWELCQVGVNFWSWLAIAIKSSQFSCVGRCKPRYCSNSLSPCNKVIGWSVSSLPTMKILFVSYSCFGRLIASTWWISDFFLQCLRFWHLYKRILLPWIMDPEKLPCYEDPKFLSLMTNCRVWSTPNMSESFLSNCSSNICCMFLSTQIESCCAFHTRGMYLGQQPFVGYICCQQSEK